MITFVSKYLFMRSRLLHIILFLLLKTLFTTVVAEDIKYGIPEIENFNRRQYNAGLQNWKITQNNFDLLYFANNNGLLEYDGVYWRLHNVPVNSPVRSVKAVDDKVYCGSYDELGYFSYSITNQFMYTSLKTPEIKDMGDFWSIHDWNSKVIFHSEKALCIFADNKLESIIEAPSRFISAFTANGLLLVQDENKGLLEIRGNRAFPIVGGDQFMDQIISCILSLSEEEMVIGTMKKGLFKWKRGEITKWETPSDYLLKELNVFCGINYNNDYLVFGSISGGLVITDKLGQILMHIDKKKGIYNNTILSLCVDKEGDIWGGLDNGIVKIALNSNVSFIQSYLDLGTGYAMHQFNEDFFLGTNQGLYKINISDFKDPLKKKENFDLIPETSGQVWSLFGKDNTILCGHNVGAFQIIQNKAVLITPPKINGVWLFKEIKDHPDLLLCGTYDGLVILENIKGKWNYRNSIEGFNESSRFLEWDNDGSLWMSHGNEGVFKLELSPNFSSVVNVDTFHLDQFPKNDNVPALTVTKIKTDILFTGMNGIYSIKNGVPEVDNRYDGFFSKGIFPTKFVEDQYNNIWYFYPQKMGVLRFQEDGSYKKIESPFVSLENKQIATFESLFIQDAKNTFLCIEDGFAHYIAGDSRNYDDDFKVHIRSFKSTMDSVSYSLSQKNDSITRQNIIPEYPFSSNSFEIEFAATYFEDDGISYSTFLSNVDENPTEWRNTTERQFTNLYEGEYRFVVKAKNRHNVITQPISFSFVVLPPWYRSLGAKIGYFIFALSCLILLIRYINRRIDLQREREKRKQQREFKEKENRLKNETLEKEKELVKIRNEKLRNDVVHKEKELANSTIHIIHKNEFLTQVKDQLNKIKEIGATGVEQKISSLIRKIDKDIDSESYWKVFETHLEQVHEDFLIRLKSKHPNLSVRENKLCAYIRMGMSSKEIAALMNISSRAVENNRYRLRQKLNLVQKDNLVEYINSI